MEDLADMNNMDHLYLAKIYLVKAGDTYLIENIENVPFGQYVMNNPLSAAIQQLMAKNYGFTAPITDGSIEAAATRAEKTSREIASGTCRIHFNAGGRKGERFFSDEIVHGLGLGSVTIILGVSQANSMTFGSLEVFEKEDPCVEMAAKLNPAKGTFVIGVRLIANTTMDGTPNVLQIDSVDEADSTRKCMKIHSVTANPYCPAIDGVNRPKGDGYSVQQTLPLRGQGELNQLSLDDQLDHVIVNNSPLVLRTIKQAVSTDLVYHPCRSAGELENLINSVLGEDIMVGTCVFQVSFYVISYLGPIKVGQPANHVNPLPYRCI
jgi:hypothetical protein